MEFDEIKKIWDEQNNQTMYAINEDTLHRRVTSKAKAIGRSADRMEIGIIAITIFVDPKFFSFLQIPWCSNFNLTAKW